MKKQCFKCEKIKDIRLFYKHAEMHDGHLNKCKECCKAEGKKNYHSMQREDKCMLKLGRYKTRSKHRGLDYDLTNKQFRKLCLAPCEYCGGYSNKERINGIDRIDNNMGYIPRNVVSCCKWCNVAKGKRDLKEFEDYLDRLVKFRMGLF